MRSLLELALIACSYRPIRTNNEKIIYAKLCGFTWIKVDIDNREISSWFLGNKNKLICWSYKTFEEIFEGFEDTLEGKSYAIQYYELYNSAVDHGNCPIEHISKFMLIDNYFKIAQYE